MLKSQEWRSVKTPDRHDAAVRLIRGVQVPRKNTLAWFRVFKRLSCNEAVPSTEMNRCRGLWRGSLEG
eukprot:3489863-Pyramimonas_sp.AAC.1